MQEKKVLISIVLLQLMNGLKYSQFHIILRISKKKVKIALMLPMMESQNGEEIQLVICYKEYINRLKNQLSSI
ncbi:MAG: hypothetical protein ACJAXJ_001163 [Colwellia sp.]|jgi:hypothetical protein